LAAVNRELLLPRFRDELSRSSKDLVGDKGQKLTPLRDNRTDILFRGKATYGNGKRISKPDFLLPEPLRDYGKELVAENAFYREPEGTRPGGYLLDNVQEPTALDGKASLTLGGKPVIVTPRDAPDWLRRDQCFVVSEVGFDQLTGGVAWRQYSSTAELISGLRNRSLDFGADVRVAIHARFVQPFLDVTLLFLGLPLVLRREHRNVFIAIGMAAVLVAGFMMVVTAFHYMGSSVFPLSPALAAWGPLMIFVPLAVGMSDAMRQ
jgi:lipopolysaccharide export system permease protein